MSKKSVYILVLLIFVLVAVLAIVFLNNKPEQKPNKFKIGVVTDLTGPASYWGTSTKIGAELAKEELALKNIDIDISFEDYQLEGPKALNAVQKLENVDKVDAYYIEFNPGIYSTTSFLKDKQKPVLYDAAPTSPLKESGNFHKTYLDYKKGCKEIALKFKQDGVVKIGSLKGNLEFAELCEEGIREVYGTNIITQNYDLGETDFKTSLLKMKDLGAKAVINSTFEAETLNTLKGIKEQNLDLKFGTVADSVTPNVLNNYSNELKGGYSFGFKPIDTNFVNKVKAKDSKITTFEAAALGYLHIKQLANALNTCNKEISCVNEQMAKSSADAIIGFEGYADRIGVFKTEIKAY